MKDLRSLDTKEFLEFLDSFDRILADADGVLGYPLKDLPRAVKCANSLRQLGKPIAIVTNSCLSTAKGQQERFKARGLDLEENDIFRPTDAIISHLKKINCTKPVYVVGMPALRLELQEAGFTPVNDKTVRIKETIKDFCAASKVENSRIGAVVVDFTCSLNYIYLQKAANYLQDPDVVFITGVTDKTGPLNENEICMGTGNLQDILEEITGRKPFVAGKPGRHLGDIVVEKLKIKDRGRVLFVGDSIPTDMGFATNAGFMKLLVLSGLAKIGDVLEWKFPKELKPDYYVDSLEVMQELIEKHFGKLYD